MFSFSWWNECCLRQRLKHICLRWECHFRPISFESRVGIARDQQSSKLTKRALSLRSLYINPAQPRQQEFAQLLLEANVLLADLGWWLWALSLTLSRCKTLSFHSPQTFSPQVRRKIITIIITRIKGCCKCHTVACIPELTFINYMVQLEGVWHYPLPGAVFWTTFDSELISVACTFNPNSGWAPSSDQVAKY